MSSLIANGLKLLPKTYQGQGVIMIILLTIVSLFDFFSIALFIPVLLLLAGNVQPEVLTNVFLFFGLDSKPEIIVFSTVVAISMVVLKTVLANSITSKKAKFAYEISDQLAKALVKKHFARPFLSYSKLDYTHELNRISNLPLIYANNFVIPLGTVLSEAIVAVLLLMVVSLYSLKLMVSMAIVVAPMLMLLLYRKRKAARSGEDIKKTYPVLLKHTMQIIEGFSEMRAFGKEGFFESKFESSYKRTSGVMAADHALHSSISRSTELIAAVVIGSLIIISVFINGGNLLLTLGLYTTVAFRLIPSVNRITSALFQIRTHGYAVDDLATPDQVELPVQREPLSFMRIMELQNISFGYEGTKPIFQNFDLAIHRGSRTIISGKSGSGKSTLLYLLLNFLKPSEGKIVVDEREVTGGFRLNADFISQNPYMLDASIAENIAFGEDKDRINISKINSIVEELGLDDWVNSLPDKIDTVIGEKGARVSGGQRQRIAIGRALYFDSEMLLLDEITNQLDRQTEFEIVKIFERPVFVGRTIILISHHPEAWKSFGTHYELRDGKLINLTRAQSAS